MKPYIAVYAIAAMFGLFAIMIFVVTLRLVLGNVVTGEDVIDLILPFAGLGCIPLWICIGLLRHSRDARVVVLTLCWLVFISLPFSVFAIFRWINYEEFAFGLMVGALCCWMYKTLTNRDVRKNYFGLDGSIARNSPTEPEGPANRLPGPSRRSHEADNSNH